MMEREKRRSGEYMSGKKPNVVFLIADDHSFGAIRAYGNRQVRTPVLDRLANQGAMFQSVYIMGAQTAAVCVPSRACLHTGTNIFRALASDQMCLEDPEDTQNWNINPRLETLPEVFRKAGYETYGIGKWHNGEKSFSQGFTGGDKLFFGGMSDHTGMKLHSHHPGGRYPPDAAVYNAGFSTDLFADAAVDFIERYEREDPFFLYVAFTAPHDPRTPPAPFRAMYDPKDIELPANFMKRHPFDNGELSIRDEMLASIPRKPEEIRQHMADYYAMVSHLDAKIGQILDALEQRGMAEHTLIVYTADHGLAVGQHGLMGKQNLYEHSVHIPLLVSGPGVPPRKIHPLCCQIDIFPTLCELAGVAPPETVEGRSLVPLMTGQAHKVRETVFSAYKDIQRMVSDGRWKLILYFRSLERNVGTERLQLFDVENDPLEMNDLSNDDAYRPELQRLLAALRDWQTEIGDPLLHPSSNSG